MEERIERLEDRVEMLQGLVHEILESLRAQYDRSEIRERAYVAEELATTLENLLESELFSEYF